MYKVIKYFTDLQDNRHAYNVGDTFPREGLTVKQERFDELAGSENKQGVPLIEEVKEIAETEEPVKENKKPATKRAVKKAAE